MTSLGSSVIDNKQPKAGTLFISDWLNKIISLLGSWKTKYICNCCARHLTIWHCCDIESGLVLFNRSPDMDVSRPAGYVEHVHLLTITWNVWGDAGQKWKVIAQTSTLKTSFLCQGQHKTSIAASWWAAMHLNFGPNATRGEIKTFPQSSPQWVYCFCFQWKIPSSSDKTRAPAASTPTSLAVAATLCALMGFLEADWNRKLLHSLQLNGCSIVVFRTLEIGA